LIYYHTPYCALCNRFYQIHLQRYKHKNNIISTDAQKDLSFVVWHLQSPFMIPVLTVKSRSHGPSFQPRRGYGVDTKANRDHTIATPTSTALNRDKTCSIGDHRQVAPMVSIFFKQPGLTGTHRGAKQRRLIPWHQRSSSGMIRISTVLNRHELCSRWRCGDYRFGHSKSRRRAGIAPTLADRTTVWHGSSR